MKKIIWFILLFIAVFVVLFKLQRSLASTLSESETETGTDALHPVRKNNLWGFISGSGKLEVTPKFFAVGEFNAGLAPARAQGLYGFINKQGKYIIPEQYDYAERFNFGIAKVWINGKLHIIDTLGNILLDLSSYRFVNIVEGGLIIVSNESGTEGLITKKGEFLLDTIYDEVKYANHNRFIVEGIEHEEYSQDHERIYEIGLVDDAGNWIVEFGAFKDIEAFQNGYAFASIESNDENWEWTNVLIDTLGEIQFELPLRDRFALDHFVSENLIGVSQKIYEKENYTQNELLNLKSYTVFYNVNGEKVIDNRAFEYAKVFSNGRSFAGTYFNWRLINKQGKVLSDDIYTQVKAFQNGIAVVELNNDKWGVIDTNGVFVVKPEYDYISSQGFTNGLLPVAKRPIYNESSENHNRTLEWGFIDAKGSQVVEFRFDLVDPAGFRNGLMYVKEGSIEGYINKSGKYVWQTESSQPKLGQALDSLNVDFMMRGYFYAYSFASEKHYHGAGGSSNIDMQISEDLQVYFPKTDVGIQVLTEELDTFNRRYYGYTTFLFNQSKDTAIFNAEDSRLAIKVQAIDAEGEWSDIEYLPHSWCGNSMHLLELPPGQCWKFVVPVYQGDFNTKLRIVLITSKKIDGRWKLSEEESEFIYSNTFSGSVNPAQFWRKQGYSPMNIMDPYFE
ncbi:WG repeat-containing protein [bacterium]|nr:WG repeat-containing protein [bacterium]